MPDRDLSAGMLAAISAGTVRLAILYEGVFVSGGVDTSVYLWTGIGTLTWDGHAWLAGGILLGISPVEETGETRAVGFEVSLSGMSQTMVSLFLQSVRSGRRGKLWLALFNAGNWSTPIDAPYPIRSGRFDVGLIEDDGDKCIIVAKYEDRLRDLERPRENRWTKEDQDLLVPGDTGFDSNAALQDAVFVW
jgi:hypothetical protein